MNGLTTQRHLLVQRIVLLTILIILLFVSFTGEKLPYNGGLGWDGEDYFNILKNFSKLYLNHGINAYHIQRILPFMIIHYVFIFLGVPITNETAIIGCCVLNCICILLTVVYFFKISKVCQWKPKTEMIAFAICFFNVPVLKIFGYYPFLTDCPVYLLSYMAIFYFLDNNRVMLIFIGILSMVTFPLLALIIWILAFLPQTKILLFDKSDKTSSILYHIFHLASTFWLPFLFFGYCLATFYIHPERSFQDYYDHRPAISFYHALISIFMAAIFFYIATKPLKIAWKSVINEIFFWKNIILLVTSFCVFVLLYYLSKYYGGDASFSPLGQLIVLQEYPSSDILIFLETHFLYLGLFFLLIIFLWKDIVTTVCDHFGIGYLFVLIFGLFFITEIETRKLGPFYPILLIPLMTIIDGKNLKSWVPITFILISLFLSFFWWKINVPGIEESFIARIHNYRTFPAQRYFMFMGPWQSRVVYIVIAFVEIIFGSIIYFLHKKGYLYSKNSNVS